MYHSNNFFLDIDDITTLLYISEKELKDLESMLESLDGSVSGLKENIDSMRPAYQHAMQLLATANTDANVGPTAEKQRNNLIFHGIEYDELEQMMGEEPEFCRDILETKIKGVLREHLKISRDVMFTTIYRIVRFDDEDEVDKGPRPIVAGFKSGRDKENVIRQAKLLKGKKIWITEDCSDKSKVPGRKSRNPSPVKKVAVNKPGRRNNDRLDSCTSSNSGNSSSS